MTPVEAAQLLRDVAEWGDRTQDHYYWGYDETGEKLRALADRVERGEDFRTDQ